MTVDEMRERMISVCESHPMGKCGDCPLFNVDIEGSCIYGLSDEVLKEHYEIMFPPEPEVSDESTEDCGEELDNVNQPKHYKIHAMECIDEMILLFGREAVKNFCKCNAWKYRYRSSAKNGKEDLEKADWYINKYRELSEYGEQPFQI